MSLDLEKFRQYVDHCDLTDEQKIEVLRDLWSIMESFVDEAWGLCPTQQFANDNEQISTHKRMNMRESFNVISLNDNERQSALTLRKRKHEEEPKRKKATSS
jgi:hypothetical protein